MGMQEFGWIAVLLLMSFGLNGTQTAAAEGNPEQETVVQGNNTFAFDLYAKLRAKPGNLFFCPYSIRTALTMTFAGARNNTARQMAQTLHLNADPQRVHPAVQAWLNELSPAAQPAGYQLQIANALWGQTGHSFQKDFRDLLQTYYGAGLREVNFAASGDEARKTINAWVTEQTQGKITDLIKAGILTPTTVLVLTNAIYFKGKWALPFDPQKTTEAPFTLSSGEKVPIPLMRQTAAVNYMEDDAVQVLEFPYEGAHLSMVFVLPKKPEQFSALEKGFTAESLQAYLARFQNQKVLVGLPKFTIHADFSLSAVLTALGMTDAFALPPADFSGMTGKPDLTLSEVLHQAFVEVNEAGTEAAAATAVIMTRGLTRQLSFQADHPFLVVIRDQRSNGVLFLGRVMDPRG